MEILDDSKLPGPWSLRFSPPESLDGLGLGLRGETTRRHDVVRSDSSCGFLIHLKEPSALDRGVMVLNPRGRGEIIGNFPEKNTMENFEDGKGKVDLCKTEMFAYLFDEK